MEITFGIISVSGNESRINRQIDSILVQNIPKFEIIVVGGGIGNLKYDVKKIDFNEKLKPKPWITRKKNLINKNAKYDIIVFMHDYVMLEKGWYEGMLKFGTDWDVCMTKILNIDGKRGTDWITARASDDFGVWNVSVPYNYNKTWKMYVSGTYWISKKYVLEQYPLDEKRLHGELEDVEWSTRWNRILKYKMNDYSSVRTIINKPKAYPELHEIKLNGKHMGLYTSKFMIDNPEYEHGLDPGFDRQGNKLPYRRRSRTWWTPQFRMEKPDNF